jgi:hypothetical protein
LSVSKWSVLTVFIDFDDDAFHGLRRGCSFCNRQGKAGKPRLVVTPALSHDDM